MLFKYPTFFESSQAIHPHVLNACNEPSNLTSSKTSETDFYTPLISNSKCSKNREKLIACLISLECSTIKNGKQRIYDLYMGTNFPLGLKLRL